MTSSPYLSEALAVARRHDLRAAADRARTTRRLKTGARTARRA